ncbi:MAG TPA: biopolymer transporter ExbD [Chitinophagaceae bacterium]|nr:biopolymer transporter ExbD [Chitinophagaceae bacterium]
MAEIQQKECSRKHRGICSKKLSTRIDLTPMVDLGFLLITFFIFTTTLSKPAAMKLILPADGGGSTSAESKTLSLILSSDNNVVYYFGLAKKTAAITNYSASGLRTIVENKMKKVGLLSGNKSETVVLIKPTNYSTYKNVVDALDEMKISGITRFVLMDATEEEAALLIRRF